MSPAQNLPPGCEIHKVAISLDGVTHQGSIIAPSRVKAQQILRDRVLQERAKGKRS